MEGFSGEILSKTVNHSRNKSDTFHDPPDGDDGSHATAVHKWISNILEPTNHTPSSDPTTHPHHPPSPDPALASILPPRRSFHRKSRFQTQPSATIQQGIQVPSRRSFATSTSSPEHPPPEIQVPAARRSLSLANSLPLSPPRNLVESAFRRSLSSSTCSPEKNAPRADANGLSKQGEGAPRLCLNGFLKEQRVLIQKVMDGELNAKAKIVLSGPSNS